MSDGHGFTAADLRAAAELSWHELRAHFGGNGRKAKAARETVQASTGAPDAGPPGARYDAPATATYIEHNALVCHNPTYGKKPGQTATATIGGQQINVSTDTEHRYYVWCKTCILELDRAVSNAQHQGVDDNQMPDRDLPILPGESYWHTHRDAVAAANRHNQQAQPLQLR
jgi:hypothetical protein